ncbi:MAG TPA: hypothetical protein VKP00_15010, partial [Gemmatimonadaceae bacterium]|nr:hypothetical protein [Gemmatimonadaceae bacterium]
VHQITPAGGAATSGGEPGVILDGGLMIPVAGPFRPVDSIFAFDDYVTPYAPLTAGVPSVEGVGYTSILRNGGAASQFTINKAAGPLGPGVGSMMGVMDLQLIGAGAGTFISATQFRDGADSGQCIDMAKIASDFELAYGARVSFESTGDFELNQRAFAGFREQIDLSVIGLREGAWFHPKNNGLQENWFAFYRIADDTGIVTADIDTGVRVGFTPAHPFDGRAAQTLLIDFVGPRATCVLNFYIDGTLVVGPVALQNPASRVTPMESLASVAAAQSNTMYVDWAMWFLNPGRIV